MENGLPENKELKFIHDVPRFFNFKATWLNVAEKNSETLIKPFWAILFSLIEFVPLIILE